MKRKAIGARRQTGVAEGESKVVLAIRVRTSMCLRTVVGVYGVCYLIRVIRPVHVYGDIQARKNYPRNPTEYLLTSLVNSFLG